MTEQLFFVYERQVRSVFQRDRNEALRPFNRFLSETGSEFARDGNPKGGDLNLSVSINNPTAAAAAALEHRNNNPVYEELCRIQRLQAV